MCQTYICRYKPYNRPPFGLNSFRSVALPHGWVHCSSSATAWIGWAAGNTNSQSATQPLINSSDHLFSFAHLCLFIGLFIQKHLFFLIDIRTNVWYNVFSATILGRRLVLLTEDCDLWSHRNLFAEILWKEDCVHVDDGTIYIHYQLMYYLFCSWVYHWFSEQ